MIELSVEERNVYAKEKVTTPAGTFNCIRSSENHVAKIGDQEFFNKVVCWYADYNKAGEPTLEIVLTKEE